MSLAKKHKIGNSARVEQVYKKGRRISGRLLQFRFLQNRAGRMRFAFTVKRNTAKTAVTRNLMRRRVYEAIRRNFPATEKPCYDVVVLLSSTLQNASFHNIENDMKNVISLFTKSLRPASPGWPSAA